MTCEFAFSWWKTLYTWFHGKMKISVKIPQYFCMAWNCQIFGNGNVISFFKTPQNNLLFHTASEYIYHVLMGSTSCHLLIRKNRIWDVLRPRVGGSASPTFAWMITTRTVSISENGNCLPMMSFHSTTAFGCINLRGLLSAVSHGN